MKGIVGTTIEKNPAFHTTQIELRIQAMLLAIQSVGCVPLIDRTETGLILRAGLIYDFLCQMDADKEKAK